MVARPSHFCVPRIQGHRFCQAQVLREPQQAAPGLISVPPCPPGFLVVRFRPSWYAEVDDEAYIGFVDAEALRQSGNPRFY